jgi:hypothetical protein
VVACALPSSSIPEDSSAADAAQQAGYDLLKVNSIITPTLTLENGAVRFASFDLPVPGNMRRDNLSRAQWFLSVYKDLLRMQNSVQDWQLLRRAPDGVTLVFR